MIPANTPVGTLVWATSWGNAYKVVTTLVTSKNIAYLTNDEIKVLNLDDCFLSKKEACQAASLKAFKESQAQLKKSHDWTIEGEKEEV